MANSICFEGVIKWIGTKREGIIQSSGKAWASLDFMIEEQEGQYPQSVVCSIFGENKIAEMMPTLNEVVTAHLNFKAHSYKGNDGVTRVSTNIGCWKLERPNEQPQPQQAAPQPQQTTAPFDSGSSTELPF